MMLYGILLAALVAAFIGAFSIGRQAGVRSQTEVDTPIIAAARAEKALAVQANDGLQRDLLTIRTDVATCNAKVDESKKTSDALLAGMAAVIQASDERAKQMRGLQARFDAGAHPPQPIAADLQCETARTVLGDLSDKMRGILGLTAPPPVKAPTVSVTTKIKGRSAITTVGKP